MLTLAADGVDWDCSIKKIFLIAGNSLSFNHYNVICKNERECLKRLKLDNQQPSKWSWAYPLEGSTTNISGERREMEDKEDIVWTLTKVKAA